MHSWGTERVAVLMANHYATKGVDTTLLSVGRPSEAFRFELHHGVKVDCLNIPLESGLNLFRKIESIFTFRKYLKRNLGKLREMNASKITPGENCTTILLGFGNFPLILAALAPKRDNFRTISSLHTPYKSIRHIWKMLRWLLYGRLDKLVALTHRDASLLSRHHPNVRVIPNPVTFYPNQAARLESKLILAIGRMDWLKGYDLMLEVYERFCQKNSDWKLKIIGEGPSKSDIEKLVKEKALTYRVTIAPATSQIEEEYKAASIYLMTSRSEGWGLVLTEAQACGLPIVAFNCETGPAEIIQHGVDGYLIEPNDFEEMSDRLQELATNSAKRKAFGSSARENVKRFLPEVFFKEWDELFLETLLPTAPIGLEPNISITSQTIVESNLAIDDLRK